MSGKHTPGPWRMIFYDAGDRDYYDHNGPTPGIFSDEHDCGIVHWDGFKQKYWSSANGNQQQMEANARLIAAAPDMLAALVALQRHFDGMPSTPKSSTLLALLANADLAIAKATGAAS